MNYSSFSNSPRIHQITYFTLSGIMMIYFDYKTERVDRENFIKQMDDMVWRNTSKHIVNQALIVSQLNNSNQLSLFSCNKMASNLFNIKSSASFNKFLTNAKLNLGDCVFNSRIFEQLPFKKSLQNLREYLLARHSKMQYENTNNLRLSQIQKTVQNSETHTNIHNDLYAFKKAALQATKSHKNNNSAELFAAPLQINSDPGGQFDARIGGGGGKVTQRVRGLRKMNCCQVISNFLIQACRKLNCFKNKNSNQIQKRKQYCDSIEELTTNKGIDDNYLFTNNNPSMENVGNFLDLLEDTPTKSLDVDYLNCNITIKDNERNYRISVFKYKGGPSGDKSPLLILCIDEIKKNDFISLKEQILEKGHFIYNILEFFSGQLKTQMNFLNDHLKYNYSSHNLLEINENSDDADYLRTIDGLNAGAGTGSRSYNIAESQDMTSKSLVDINKTIKGIKYDKQNISGYSPNLQPHYEGQGQFNYPFLQKAINKFGMDDGQINELQANNHVKGFIENRQNFLAPPPISHPIYQKSQSRGNSPDNSPKKEKLSARKNIDTITRKCDTLEISGNPNHINNSNNQSSKNFNQIKQNQNQTIQININNSSNNIINIQQTIGNNNNNLITNINNNNKNINTNNINITVNSNIINSNILNSKSINNNKINTLNDQVDNQQYQKIQHSNKGPLNSDDIKVILVNNSEMEFLNENKDKIICDKDMIVQTKTKDILTLPLIEAKKIVSEHIFQDDDIENNQYQNNSIDKQQSDDEVINQYDNQLQNKYQDKLIKFNKNLIEICHNTKLIALKSLIQVSNYSDCFRHKESKPLPLKISEFSISELILDTFYFNSKPVLIYKSKYQHIKSDERRLIQVIFNILNFLMKKTDQSIKFIVMDKEEYDKQKLNQSISKQLSSRNKIDTAKFIQQNISKMFQSNKGNDNIIDPFNKKKDINSNFIVLQDVKNSQISCNLSSESTPYAQYPQKFNEVSIQQQQAKILTERQQEKENIKIGNTNQVNQQGDNNTTSMNKISLNKEEFNSPNKLQNSRDIFQMTFNQNAVINNKTFENKNASHLLSNHIQPQFKQQIQTNATDRDNFNNLTNNNKVKTIDITPVSIQKDMSNFIMLTNNFNTQNQQVSQPNLSYQEEKYNQNYNKMQGPQNQEEIVLENDFDDDNDYYIAQKIKEKKQEQKKFTMDSRPHATHNQQIKNQDEISSENYCESIQNENIVDVVLNNLDYHCNEKILKEIGLEENYQSHLSISNESKNQNQILQYNSQSQSKATIQSMKLNNETATVLYNLKSAAINIDGSNQSSQQPNIQQFSFNRQLSYNQANSKNGFKEGTATNGLTSIISSSAKLDNQNNKDSLQILPEKSITDQITFFQQSDAQNDDYIFQQQNQDQIFRNLVNIQNQNQKNNYNQQLLGESTNNLREPSKSMISGNGKNQFLSPTVMESQQNFNSFQYNNINNNNNYDIHYNFDFQSNHKALPRSQFSKSLQQYPTVSFLPAHDKNNLNLQESIPPEDIESGLNINNNFYSTPIEEDMFKSQNLIYNNQMKNIKLFDGQLKKKSSIKKNINPLKLKSRANSNNSSIIQKQSLKSGSDINNQKLYSPTKRQSNLGTIQKLIQINSIQSNQEESQKNVQYQNNMYTVDEINLFSSNSDVIVIEIQMEGENMKFIPDNNESIQMIATNEIIKLLGPNRKIQITPNSISFFLYTNLDECDLVRNQISNQEKFEELLNLKELMNPKAVQNIKQINKALIVDNKTCKTIYTLENQAHNFTLIEQEDLETHNKLQSEKLQNQLQYQNKLQNHTDFLSLHSFSKHNSPKLNVNNLTRSYVQTHQQINQKFSSARQDNRQNKSISPNSKVFLSPQLNIQRVFQGGAETLVNNTGNLAQSYDQKHFYQTNKSIKDNDYLQSNTQRSQVPLSTQQYQNSYNMQRQENQSEISNNRVNNSSKIQFKKISLDENKSTLAQPSKISSLQTATTNHLQIKSQQYLQKSFTTTNKSCVLDQQ